LKENLIISATPFVPDLGDDLRFNCEEWHEQAMEDSQHQFKIRLLRVFFIVTVPMILLIASSYIPVSFSFIVGIGLLFMFIIFFIIFFRIIFIFGNHENDGECKLYRIYSMSQRPPKWAANLDISYIQLLYKNNSIHSISELCAVHGGVTKSMLNTLGAYTWIAVTIHYIEQIKHENSTFIWDVADICIIIGTMGLLLISIFELDPFNKKMRSMHTFGALSGTAAVLGFILQQYSHHNGDYLIISITFAIICFTAFIAWNITKTAADLCQLPMILTQEGGEQYNCFWTRLTRLLVPNYKRIGISLYSRMNIGFEAIFLFMGALCLCLFLMDY